MDLAFLAFTGQGHIVSKSALAVGVACTASNLVTSRRDTGKRIVDKSREPCLSLKAANS